MKKIITAALTFAMAMTNITPALANEMDFEEFETASESSNAQMGQYIEEIPSIEGMSEYDNEAASTDKELLRGISTYSTKAKAFQEVSGKYDRVFRLYNPNTSEHFYTLDENERAVLMRGGWVEEGVSWYSLKEKDANAVPVYRLLNSNNGDHHYTVDEYERQCLIEAGWKAEGIAWYGMKGTSGKPIYRCYNPNATAAGTHHFCRSENEYNTLAHNGWHPEEVSFYAPKVNTIEQENGRDVWYDETGTPSYGEAYYDGDWCYFDSNGRTEIKNAFVKVPNKETVRYYGSNGRAVKGNAKIGSTTYIFDRDNATLLYNGSSSVSNTQMMIDKNGNMEIYDRNGRPVSGEVLEGNVVFTTDKNGTVIKTELLNVPRYFQSDSRWGNVSFGDTTFRHIGCVPTVLAMALEGLNAGTYQPIDVAYAMANAGYFNGQFNVGKVMGASGHGIAWAAQNYGMESRGDYLTDLEIEKILKAGGVVAFTLKPNTVMNPDKRYNHEVLLYGYDNGMVQVHDPLFLANNRSFDMATLSACKVNYEPGYVNLVWGFLHPAVNVHINW